MQDRSKRKDKRRKGDGYITKQGYRLVYINGRYHPAHRVLFPDLPKDWVVHHIDGNKLNNTKENLIPCSKKKHREMHGQLERLSYFLIQQGFIQSDEEGNYSFSTSMKKFIDENSVNSGEPGSVDSDGNPEPSPVLGRCNDYPKKE